MQETVWGRELRGVGEQVGEKETEFILQPTQQPTRDEVCRAAVGTGRFFALFYQLSLFLGAGTVE